jgi:hypothetical protein
MLAGLAAIMIGLLAPGCGGEDTTEGHAQSYAALLAGLERAALTGETYGALRRAANLNPPERAVIDAFCETAWQLEANGETAKLEDDAYIVERIEYLAEYDLVEVRGAVRTAVGSLHTALDLPAIDRELNRRYKRACYG